MKINKNYLRFPDAGKGRNQKYLKTNGFPFLACVRTLYIVHCTIYNDITTYVGRQIEKKMAKKSKELSLCHKL